MIEGYSFPRVSEYSQKLFPEEINKLTELWNHCCQNFEVHALLEEKTQPQCTPQQSGCATGGSIAGIVGGSASIVTGLYFAIAAKAIFLPILCFSGGTGVIGLSVWSWKKISDTNYQTSQLLDFRIQSHRTIEKIENCVRLINQVGELYAAWEIAKNDPSDENLTKLFNQLDLVHTTETDLTIESKDPIAPYLLMDDLASVATNPHLEDWRAYSSGNVAQPPKLKYFNHNYIAFCNYIIFRESNKTLQVDNKVASLKKYISHAL